MKLLHIGLCWVFLKNRSNEYVHLNSVAITKHNNVGKLDRGIKNTTAPFEGCYFNSAHSAMIASLVCEAIVKVQILNKSTTA